jgi:hypothetical protein
MIRITTWIAFPLSVRRKIEARRREREEHETRVAKRLFEPSKPMDAPPRNLKDLESLHPASSLPPKGPT